MLPVYLFLTVLIAILDNLLPGSAAVNYFKFTVICSFFPVALIVGKGYREQLIMTLAVFLMVVGDFFLNLCSTIPALAGDVSIFGVLSFLMAYLALLAVLSRGRRLGWEKYLFAVPVLAVFLPAFFMIAPHLRGDLLAGVLLFGCVLCLMAWAAICTLFRGYYSRQVSLRFALAGYLILISDIGVANQMLHPAGSPIFIPLLKNIIWGTYIPAWALLVKNIGEDRLLA